MSEVSLQGTSPQGNSCGLNFTTWFSLNQDFPKTKVFLKPRFSQNQGFPQMIVVRSHEERELLFEDPTQSRISPRIL